MNHEFLLHWILCRYLRRAQDKWIVQVCLQVKWPLFLTQYNNPEQASLDLIVIVSTDTE